jgi:hypothetical protein
MRRNGRRIEKRTKFKTEENRWIGIEKYRKKELQ